MKKLGLLAGVALIMFGTVGTADAQRWRGGGWRGGGWGWGVGPGFALGLGLGAAPYYAYGGPYYGSYAYGGDCVMRRRAVINRWGHRVWRWVRVCY